MWSPEKIQSYITDQVEESLYLDYKAAEALAKTEGKKNDISKDVSSFANSDGGIIIYGIKEYSRENTFLPEKVDPINRNEFSRETLEQIINSKIFPKIHGIVITPIIIDKDLLNEVIYVVEIPKSHTAHQASDKRYYRRFNFQSVPMDDWEIKDIINRQDKTNCVVRLKPRFNRAFHLDFHPTRGRTVEFDVVATNIGNIVVNLIDCSITGTEDIAKHISPAPPFGKKGFELYYTNEETRKARVADEEFIVNIQRIPILPQTFRKMGQIAIYIDFFIDNMEIEIVVATEDNRTSELLRGFDILGQ